MTQSISRGFLIPLFLSLGLLVSPHLVAAPVAGNSAKLAECPVCGMTFRPTAKTAFFTKVQEKPRHLCSFACATKTSDKFPEAKFEVTDFSSDKTIPGDDAYFLVRSKNLLKELDFDMPPTVVAFASEKAAKDKTTKLGDGEVIRGWKNLKQAMAH